jgi:hypothetical protein
MKNSKTKLTINDAVYTANVIGIEENGDAIIEMPQKLLDQMGWKEGTNLDISLNERNEIILKEIIL